MKAIQHNIPWVLFVFQFFEMEILQIILASRSRSIHHQHYFDYFYVILLLQGTFYIISKQAMKRKALIIYLRCTVNPLISAPFE